MATDNFNRADSPDLGPNWTEQYAAVPIEIVGNHAAETVFGVGAAYWNANACGPDQYAEVTVAGITGNASGGPTVRASGADGAAACYTADVLGDGAGINLDRVSGTTFTQLAHAATQPVNGDRVGITAVGPLLTVWVNGVAVCSARDTTLASGQPGIFLLDNTAMSLDDWEGGPYAPATAPFMAQMSGQMVIQ